MAGKTSVPGSKRAQAQPDLIGEEGKQDGKIIKELIPDTADPNSLVSFLAAGTPGGSASRERWACSAEPSTAPCPGLWETPEYPQEPAMPDPPPRDLSERQL